MKRIYDEEIDYDIVIKYHRAQCPLTCGDKVRGMITDDTGKTHTFPGEGHVVAIESEIVYGPGTPKHTVYLKTPFAKPLDVVYPFELSDSAPTVSDGGR